MKKKLRKPITIMLVVALCIAVLSFPINAYERLGGKLSGGIYNRTYYVGMSSSSYVNACIAAIDDWNWAVNSSNNGVGSDFYFTRVYTTNATIRFWAEKQPFEYWTGLTRLYDASGNYMNDNGSYKTKNWAYASIIFNTTNSPVSNANEMRAIAGHEIGHAIGLAHTNDKGTLMYPDYVICTAIVPTTDEMNGARALYS